jgi:hypothetical protein
VNAAGTQITGIVVPTGAATGPVTVTTAGGVSNAVNFSVTAAAGWQTAVGFGQSGSNGSGVAGVASDKAENVYIMGSFTGTATFGSTTLTAPGAGTFMFVAKWSHASQAFVWAMQVAATARAIAVAGASVYVTGSCTSGTAFGSSTASGPSAGAYPVAFVARLNDAGTSASWAWAQAFSNTFYPRALAATAAEVYVAGDFQTFAGSETLGGYTLTALGNWDVFAAKFSAAAGTVVWAQSGGGTGEDHCRAVALEGTSVYLAGSTRSTAAAFGSVVASGSGSALLVKLTDAGASSSFTWAQRGGGAGDDYASGVATNGSSVYIAGQFTSATAVFGATTLTNNDATGAYPDLFVAKLTDAGSSAAYAWATGAGGRYDERATGLTANGNNLYVTGYVNSTLSWGTSFIAGSSVAFAGKLTDNGASSTYGWAYSVNNVVPNDAYPAVVGPRVYVGGGFRLSPAAFGTISLVNNTSTYVGYLASINDPSVPVLTSISPATGPVGSTVLLNGNLLTGATAITFAGTATNTVTSGFVVNAAGTQITGIVVPGGAATGSVTVTTPGGTSNGVGFTVTGSTPAISGFAPASGPVGTSVVLSGTGFSGATAVAFNGTAATGFVVNSDNQITVSVPAGATTGTISVTNAGGTATSATSFVLTAPDLVVSSGTAAAPTSVAPGSYNSIVVSGVAQLSGPTAVASSVTVNGTLLTNCQPLTGAASFTLAAGGTLGICDAAGIAASGATGAVQTTGARSFSPDASYLYTGAAAQATGSALPAQVRNLTTTNANALTLTAPTSVAGVLTVGGAGNLVLNGNALTLLSSASGTAMVVNSGTGVVQGAATVQRYIDPSLNAGAGYRHYSSPVANTTVADLATAGFAPEVSQALTYNASPTPNLVTPFPTVFGYDQSRVTLSNAYLPFDRGFVVPVGLAAPLAVGRGYVVNIPASQLVDFVGTLNNGPQMLNLTRNAAASANASDAGWQLLGNPYPAPLDYSLVAPADLVNLDAAIYVFNSTGQYAGQYRAYVNGFGGNPVLPVGQAFFARVSSGQTSGSLTFRNSQRLTSPTATAFQRTAVDTRPLVQLELRGAPGPADVLFAYAQAAATDGFDAPYDAAKLPNTSGLNLSVVAATGEALAIDGRPAFTAATVLPLVVGVPAAGSYSLSAPALHNLPAGLDAYLVDAATGQTVNLRLQASYSFAVTAAQAQTMITGRFSIRFSAAGALATGAGLSAAAVSLFPNPARDAFTVQLPAVPGASEVQAELLNALGQVVRHQTAALRASGAQFRVETAGLAQGVYLLRLRAGATVLTKRVVLQ